VVAIHSSPVVKTKCEATQRLSSGGAGGDIQATPDKASCERIYPALTCNELFERPPIVPHNACHFCYQERESAAATDNQSTELSKSRAARDGNKPRNQWWSSKSDARERLS
jgi:hypothetical protein